MSETKTNNKLGLTIQLEDFSQAQFETYQGELFRNDPKTNASKNSVVVLGAIKAGFLKGIEAEKIPAMSPAAIAWAVIEIHRHVVAVTTPPRDDENDIKN